MIGGGGSECIVLSIHNHSTVRSRVVSLTPDHFVSGKVPVISIEQKDDYPRTYVYTVTTRRNAGSLGI